MQAFRDDTEEAMNAVENLFKCVNETDTVYVQKSFKCRIVGNLPNYGFSVSTVDDCGANTTMFCEYIKGKSKRNYKWLLHKTDLLKTC